MKKIEGNKKKERTKRERKREKEKEREGERERERERWDINRGREANSCFGMSTAVATSCLMSDPRGTAHKPGVAISFVP